MVAPRPSGSTGTKLGPMPKRPSHRHGKLAQGGLHIDDVKHGMGMGHRVHGATAATTRHLPRQCIDTSVPRPMLETCQSLILRGLAGLVGLDFDESHATPCIGLPQKTFNGAPQISISTLR